MNLEQLVNEIERLPIPTDRPISDPIGKSWYIHGAQDMRDDIVAMLRKVVAEQTTCCAACLRSIPEGIFCQVCIDSGNTPIPRDIGITTR